MNHSDPSVQEKPENHSDVMDQSIIIPRMGFQINNAASMKKHRRGTTSHSLAQGRNSFNLWRLANMASTMYLDSNLSLSTCSVKRKSADRFAVRRKIRIILASSNRILQLKFWLTNRSQRTSLKGLTIDCCTMSPCYLMSLSYRQQLSTRQSRLGTSSELLAVWMVKSSSRKSCH